MRAPRIIRWIGWTALVAVAFVAVLASTLVGRSADDDKGIVANLLSRALSTPTSAVSIGEVQGALSSNVTINNVTIADRDGVWLRVDRIRLTWSRTALLRRRLEVDTLEIGTVTLSRKPLPGEQAPADDAPILPELPLKVIVKDFKLGALALGEPIVGTAAQLSASGELTLGNPAEGLHLRFDARRLDAAGSLTARLELVPNTQRLDLRLGVDEPAGGVVAHALNIPGLPPVKLDLNGTGTLDAFDAKLAFNAGPTIGATGGAQLRRENATRRLALDMAAQIEGLLPPIAAPVFAGTTQLNGNVVFADDSAITISPVSVVSQTARLDINGTLSSTQVADLKIAARALPNAGSKTAAGQAEIGKFNFDATVAGPIAGPKIVATLDAADIAAPQGKMAKLTGAFNATPNGDVTDKTTAVPFNAEVQASGIAPTDAALARALGPSLSMKLDGTLADDVFNVRAADVVLTTAHGHFEGRVGGKVLQGRLTARAPDLSRFAGVAATPLRGALALDANLSGVPDTGRIDAMLDGQATRFATGMAAVDGLAGGRLDLTGRVSKLPNGGFGFGDLVLKGQYATARLNGDATTQRAAIDANISLPDLHRADARLSGQAEATARVTGTLDRPDADVNLDVTNARALNRPVPNLNVRLTAADILGLVDARATLAGTVDGKAANGGLHFAKLASGGWQLDDVDLRVGSVALAGGANLSAGNLADGRLTLTAGNLDDLSPLVLTRLAGQMRADVMLSVANGGQNGALTASGRGVRIGENSLAFDRLDAQANVTDLYRRPVIDADVTVDRARIAGEQITQIRLLSKSDGQASAMSVTANARGFALDAKGRLDAGDQLRLTLSTLTAQRGNRRLALTQPATLTLADGGIDIRALSLAIDRGRLTVNGRAGDTFDLDVTAQSVPLSIAEVAVPKLSLSGTLDAKARVMGTAQAPTGTWQLKIANLVAPQTRDAGVPPLDISASGRLADGRSSVDGTVTARNAGQIRIAGSVPVQDGRLDLRAAGRINLAVANQFLSVAARQAGGTAEIDMRVGGTTSQPTVNGTVTLAGGSYRDPILGLNYTDISGRIVARDTRLSIERLSARTPNGGTINATGSVDIDPAAGFPGALSIRGTRAKLVENDIVSMVANMNVNLSGPLAQRPQASGTIDVVSLDITVPDRLPTTLEPLPGTKHVNPTPTAQARLTAEARDKARASRTPAFDAMLDLRITAPNRIFVRGRGIDAELGGSLRLQGLLSDPRTVGSFELRRGRLSIAGQTLNFSRGNIRFTGNLTPDLDFVADTTAGDVTATVAVSGSASSPTFAFSSSPDLPQDEVLSRILFQKASGGLSAIQALQLAQVAAQFSGSGGPDVFDRMRKSLGVDSLDVSMGTDGNPQVGVSRSINRRVSVGVKSGTDVNSSGVSVDIDVTRHIRLKGEADANGATSAGVGVEWEY